ncbi:FecR protein [Roseivivax sp. THAF40]|uniref:FecR domain-containing protein n=1 Tax=unclassified Roseivivax TaxID=2639302 RepID=UPI001268D256|nr:MULTISPECIES: FecR domain-containing protein [unclassified Roseivivax]QFS82586.1 FecR protein [Roseivivax sp. THAF197b]QFT46355.1 FecR protein [Roseivivax sp. THAF40]
MLRVMLLSLVLTGAPVTQALAQASGDGICVILSVEGAGEVFARGVRPRAAETGLGLGRNATLRTQAEARVTLQCDGDLRVIVGPDSEVAVARIVGDAPETFRMRLMRGISGFIFDGTGDDGSVQVQTPSAVAAVRSTEWAMQVTDGASAVFAREGAVDVVGETGRVTLGPGEGVDVASTGAVGPVVQWGQARINLFADLLGPDW